jgi:2-amino-4-hydroxy-6-hydroxymethyldihydropteridine diphosphokinase
MQEKVFISLGGNFPQTATLFEKVIQHLSQVETISNLQVSKIYETSPVGGVPQPNFLNMVASFDTTLSLISVFDKIESMEQELGKAKKIKNGPRAIDIDLLFYGIQRYESEKITVPHPRWDQRLFVLQPLSDLIDVIALNPPISIKKLICDFPREHQQWVRQI